MSLTHLPEIVDFGDMVNDVFRSWWCALYECALHVELLTQSKMANFCLSEDVTSFQMLANRVGHINMVPISHSVLNIHELLKTEYKS